MVMTSIQVSIIHCCNAQRCDVQNLALLQFSIIIILLLTATVGDKCMVMKIHVSTMFHMGGIQENSRANTFGILSR